MEYCHCRTCGTRASKENMESIFNSKDVANKFKSLLSLNLVMDRRLPEFMCRPCVMELSLTYEFIQKALAMQKQKLDEVFAAEAEKAEEVPMDTAPATKEATDSVPVVDTSTAKISEPEVSAAVEKDVVAAPTPIPERANSPASTPIAEISLSSQVESNRPDSPGIYIVEDTTPECLPTVLPPSKPVSPPPKPITPPLPRPQLKLKPISSLMKTYPPRPRAQTQPIQLLTTPASGSVIEKRVKICEKCHDIFSENNYKEHVEKCFGKTTTSNTLVVKPMQRRDPNMAVPSGIFYCPNLARLISHTGGSKSTMPPSTPPVMQIPGFQRFVTPTSTPLSYVVTTSAPLVQSSPSIALATSTKSNVSLPAIVTNSTPIMAGSTVICSNNPQGQYQNSGNQLLADPVYSTAGRIHAAPGEGGVANTNNIINSAVEQGKVSQVAIIPPKNQDMPIVVSSFSLSGQAATRESSIATTGFQIPVPTVSSVTLPKQTQPNYFPSSSSTSLPLQQAVTQSPVINSQSPISTITNNSVPMPIAAGYQNQPLTNIASKEIQTMTSVPRPTISTQCDISKTLNVKALMSLLNNADQDLCSLFDKTEKCATLFNECMNYIYECSVCRIVFLNRFEYNLHITKGSDGQLYHKCYPCITCKVNYASSRLLKEHHNMRLHGNVHEQFTCNLCPLFSTREDNVLKHMLKMHCFCPHCHTNLQELRSNLLAKKQICQLEPRKCQLCGLVINKRSELAMLQCKNSKDSVCICNICSLSFNSKITLTQHFNKRHTQLLGEGEITFTVETFESPRFAPNLIKYETQHPTMVKIESSVKSKTQETPTKLPESTAPTVIVAPQANEAQQDNPGTAVIQYAAKPTRSSSLDSSNSTDNINTVNNETPSEILTDFSVSKPQAPQCFSAPLGRAVSESSNKAITSTETPTRAAIINEQRSSRGSKETAESENIEKSPCDAVIKQEIVNEDEPSSGEKKIQYCCVDCPASFSQFNDLLLHVKCRHTTPFYKCDKCHRNFSNMLESLSHNCKKVTGEVNMKLQLVKIEDALK